MDLAMKKPSPPFGVSQFTTWPQTFEEDIALYREAGIVAIEVCEAKLDADRFKAQFDLIKESGLQVSSVQPRLHSLFPDQPRPEPRDPKDRMKRLRGTIERFSAHFPGTTLVTISGAAPGGDYRTAYQSAVKEYKEVARIAGDHGVRLALEPLNPILMNVDTFICSLAGALTVIEEVDEPAFGLLVDLWHVWEDAAAPDLIAKRAAHRIFGVHVNDWQTPRAFGDRHLPGDGEIPLLELLRAIRASGYDGIHALEIFSEAHLPNSLWNQPRETVFHGAERFKNLWEKVCA